LNLAISVLDLKPNMWQTDKRTDGPADNCNAHRCFLRKALGVSLQVQKHW